MSLDLLTLKSVVPPGYEINSLERWELWTKMSPLSPDEYHAHAQKQDRKGLFLMGLRFKFEEEIW